MKLYVHQGMRIAIEPFDGAVPMDFVVVNPRVKLIGGEFMIGPRGHEIMCDQPFDLEDYTWNRYVRIIFDIRRDLSRVPWSEARLVDVTNSPKFVTPINSPNIEPVKNLYEDEVCGVRRIAFRQPPGHRLVEENVKGPIGVIPPEYSPLTQSIVNQVRHNIIKHIQYNHNTCINSDAIAQINWAINDGRYWQFDYPHLNDIRSPLPVPKNGASSTEKRMMIFRRPVDNYIMAALTTDMYNRVKVDGRSLGARIVNDNLIPYIYSYDLFKQEVKKHAKEGCTYVDIKNFFESVTPQLIQHTMAHHDQPNVNIIAMQHLLARGPAHLTIDTNYEHAMATAIVAYLMDGISCDWRAFVDDIVLFTESEDHAEVIMAQLREKLNLYGLKLNEDKVRKYIPSEHLKELVFLPTGMRYRPTLELRKAAYAQIYVRYRKPELTAFSTLEDFRKYFQISEAEWVMKEYDNIKPDETDLLKYLQYMTLKPGDLTQDEVSDLLCLMEDNPSKAKWIFSIIPREYRGAYKQHKDPYIRHTAYRSHYPWSERTHGKYWVISSPELLDFLSEKGYDVSGVSTPVITIDDTTVEAGHVSAGNWKYWLPKPFMRYFK